MWGLNVGVWMSAENGSVCTFLFMYLCIYFYLCETWNCQTELLIWGQIKLSKSKCGECSRNDQIHV